MTFRQGEPGVFDDSKEISPYSPFEPFIKGSHLDIVAKVAKKRTGTRVRYWADPQIFLKTATFSVEDLEARARQTALVVPNLTIVSRGDRAGTDAPHPDGPY